MKEALEKILFTEDEEEWGIEVPENVAVALTYFVMVAVILIPVLATILVFVS